jgi:hypothetical protein
MQVSKDDFGHPWHYLIERIQNCIQEIYDVAVFPTHENALQFEPIKDFVAVGIGPLSYSADYVTKGEPHPTLKGDIRFLAKQMGLVDPPMPISHPVEKAMFNRYKGSHGKKDADSLAKLFKRKTNGSTIIPKLPSMIYQHETVWKRNNEIEMAREEMKESFKEILGALTRDKAKAPETQDATMDDGDLNVTEDTGTGSTAASFSNETGTHVAPVCAPGQSSYVPTSKTVQTSQQLRVCYYAPCCSK